MTTFDSVNINHYTPANSSRLRPETHFTEESARPGGVYRVHQLCLAAKEVSFLSTTILPETVLLTAYRSTRRWVMRNPINNPVIVSQVRGGDPFI